MLQRPSILTTRTTRRPMLPLLALLAISGRCVAQEHSRADLRAETARLEGVVHACSEAPSECRPEAVPNDEVVAPEGAQPKLTVRWGWLSDAFDKARNVSAQDRRHSMEISAARLQEIAQEAGATQNPDGGKSFDQARHTADRVLSRAEFGAVAPPSAWDRFLAKLYQWIDRLFYKIGRIGTKAPWLGTAAECFFFGATAVGLLFFLRRNFQRQRLAASLRVAQAGQAAWDREATDWADLAEKAAAAGEWREAVHCLYWAAIVQLEGRRLWRHNPARTPREYVRLLKPGTVQRESLGGLTGLLERVWYGLRPAASEDYQRARTWFDRLSDTATVGSESA